MSFMPSGQKGTRIVKGEGPKSPKIAIVGEAAGSYEEQQLRPFVGPAGGVLESCLHAASMIRSDVYITNVVDHRPYGPKGPNDISEYFNGKTFSAKGWDAVMRVREEIDAVSPNIVIACGATAFAAMTGQTRITKYRGYLFATQGMQNVHKCMPTIHPAACLHNQFGGPAGGLAVAEFKPFLFRHVIVLDMRKAFENSHTPELTRPDRTILWDFASIHEVIEWLDYFAKCETSLSVDTEVTNYELACIGFSEKPNLAISVPIANRWTLEEEILLWRALQRILGSLCPKVFQNGFFDVHFLATRCGLVVRGEIHDTMIAHSVMWPEFPKGLGFLGSLYCGTQAFWKDMVKFDNIKEES